MNEPLYELYGDLPKVPAMPYPSFEEYGAGLRAWQERWPQRMTLETPGHTLEGRPIYLARVTDRTVPDDDKQILLVNGNHSAGEISPVCGILHFLKWLLSDDPGAARLRRGLIVAAMPIIEVDAYVENREKDGQGCFSRGGGQLYGGQWTWDGVSPESKHHEARVFSEVMEQLQPDAYLDLHGAPWRDVGMQESVGISFLRLNRCFDPSVVADIERALDAAGYGVIRPGTQAGRMCVATAAGELGKAAPHYDSLEEDWAQPYRTMVVPTMLAFHRYHTISMVGELMWMGAIVVACRRLAEIGMETGFSEFFPGYPNSLVACSTNLMISAWGKTAAQRRASRVELWRRGNLALQNGVPIVLKDRMLASCAVTTEGKRLLLDPATGKGEGREKFLANIENDSRFNAAALSEFFGDFPPTMFAYDPGLDAEKACAEDNAPIRHGLAMRVCLQYRDARLQEVRHNGHLLEESTTDGYLVHHRQGTVVQVNIPPDKVHDLHVVTIRYEAAQRPIQGFATEDWRSEALRIPAR